MRLIIIITPVGIRDFLRVSVLDVMLTRCFFVLNSICEIVALNVIALLFLLSSVSSKLITRNNIMLVLLHIWPD